MSGSLPADVAEVLVAVLDGDDPVHAALLRQMPYLRVAGCCGCGCESPDFELDRSQVEPAPVEPGTFVAAEVPLFTESGDCPGMVMVFTRGGYLAWLDICSWSDDVEVNLSNAVRWLRGPRRT
ncbi:hypothetical protein [Streptomyces sp. NPDC058486]|uniref:hypothetical protein n=1 Tax=unclassified Streptomyces TaxID=2593676 RepID=UPI0036524AB3